MDDLTRKGVDILKVNPAFRFPVNGVWAVVFDEIDPLSMDFKGFQHVNHPGLSGGEVLVKVASIIFDHYTICGAGAYVFSAARDMELLRNSDLTDVYCKVLGLNGHKKSRIFNGIFPGWNAYTDVSVGGRGYVVTTDHY